MGERVLLARRREDDRYDLFRSHWAPTGRLLRAVTESGRVTLGAHTWRRCGPRRWRSLVDELSYLDVELCLRHAGVTAAYLPVWLGIPAGVGDPAPPECGLLVRVRSQRAYGRLRRELRRQTERLGEAIERGDLTPRAARRRLLAACRGRERHLSASARRL